MQINTLTLSGSIKDKKEIPTKNGGQMVAFTLLCQEEVKPKGQEPYTKSMYIKLACFGDIAKDAMALKDGQNVLATGKLNTKSYEKKDGTKGLEVQLVPSGLVALAGPSPQTDTPPAYVEPPIQDSSLDDIPF